MEKNKLSSYKELVQTARNCLDKNGEEIDRLADIQWIGTYRWARCRVLIDHLDITFKIAEQILNEINANPILKEKIKSTKDTATVVLETPWSILTDNFIEAYNTFCEENEINTSSPPSERADEIVYWFKDKEGEQHTISLWRAYELLYKDVTNTSPHEYIENIYRRLSTDTEEKQTQ